MSNSFDAVLYMAGGLFRFLDLLTDIWYVLTQTFKVQWIFYVAVGSIFAPAGIFFLVFIYLGLLKQCQGHSREAVVNFLLAFVVGALESLGIVHCVFGCAIKTQKTKTIGYFAAEGLTRAAGFIVGLVNSLPQVMIQVYNNLENKNWETLNVVSLVLSVAGFVYTLLKCFWAVDNIQKLSAEYYSKTIMISGNICVENVISAGKRDEENEEVYNFSESV